MVAPVSNYGAQEFLVDPVPYSLDEFLPDAHKRASALAAIEKVNSFAKEWSERQRGQTFEPDQISGGCALLKKDTIQKMGQFPSRTPLGTFDLPALSQRMRQLGNRIVGARDVFIHNFGARGNGRT